MSRDDDYLCDMVVKVLEALKRHQEDEQQLGPTGLFVPDDVRECIVGRKGVA